MVLCLAGPLMGFPGCAMHQPLGPRQANLGSKVRGPSRPESSPIPSLPSLGTRALPLPWASRGWDLQPPTPTPEVPSGASEGTCCRAVLEAPAHPGSQVNTFCPEGGSLCVNRQPGGVKAAPVAKGRLGWPSLLGW